MRDLVTDFPFLFIAMVNQNSLFFESEIKLVPRSNQLHCSLVISIEFPHFSLVNIQKGVNYILPPQTATSFSLAALNFRSLQLRP